MMNKNHRPSLLGVSVPTLFKSAFTDPAVPKLDAAQSILYQVQRFTVSYSSGADHEHGWKSLVITGGLINGYERLCGTNG